MDDPSKNPIANTVVIPEGHQIVEPQPVYPPATGQIINGEYDYNAQQAQGGVPGQGIPFQQDPTAAVQQSQTLSQTLQNRTNGTSQQIPPSLGTPIPQQPNGVQQTVQNPVQPQDITQQTQDFMTRSQEFISQSQDYLGAQQQNEYSGPGTPLPGTGASEVPVVGQTPNAQNASLPQSQLPPQDAGAAMGVPPQQPNLTDYTQPGQATLPPNTAKSNASPSTDNLNIQVGEVLGHDTSFRDDGTRLDPVQAQDPDLDRPEGLEGAVAAVTKGVSLASLQTEGTAVSAAGTGLLTPPLLEMVSGTLQPGAVSLINKDNGQER